MKKFTSLLLALALTLSLCVSANAASGVIFDLSCDGAQYDSSDDANWLLYAKNGQTVTLTFSIFADSAGGSVATRTVQNDIYYDHEVFQLVSCKALQSGFYAAGQYYELSGGKQYQYVRFVSVADATYTDAATPIGEAVFKVIGSRGQSTISCVNYDASYGITTRDLHVSFGAKVLPQYNLSFDTDGGDPINTITVTEGYDAVLPAASKLYNQFIDWTLVSDGSRHNAGERVTPESNLTYKANWSPVPTPAAPTGLVSVMTTDPDIRDGKITGTTSAMEYSTDNENWISCTGSQITGLSAGTYYVRLKADPKNGSYGTPAGAAAAVEVKSGPRASAPMGLGTIQESLAGAGDGKIVGTTTAMEYSKSKSFSSGVKTCGSGVTGGLTGGTYYVRIKGTATRGYSEAATVVVSVGKRPAAPTSPKGTDITFMGMDDGKITGLSTSMEYSTDKAKWTACTGSELTNLSAGTYFVRYQAVAETNTAASESNAIVINEGGLRKAPSSISSLRASEENTADGKLLGTTSDMEYSTDKDASRWTACRGSEVAGLKPGTYYVRYQAEGKVPASESTSVEISFGEKPDAPTSPEGVSTSLMGKDDGKIRGLSSSMEYSKDKNNWTDCPDGELTGLSAGTYFVRYKMISETNTAASHILAVDVNEGGLRDAPASIGSVQTSRPSSADGKLTGTTAKMEYSADNAKWTTCTENETTGLKAGVYYVRYQAEGTIPAGNSAAVEVKAGQVPVPEAPTGFTTLQESLSGAKDGKILGVTAQMEYCTDPDAGKWTSCTGTEITGLSAGSYFIRLKAVASTETPAGKITEVKLNAGSVPAAPSGLVCVPPSRPGKADGIIAGTTTAMEWAADLKSGKWYACEQDETAGFAAGTYYFRLKANAATNTVAGAYATVVMKDPEFILTDGLSSYVEVSASVSGSTATVKSFNSEQLEEALLSGYVELDLSDLGTMIDSVKLPRDLFVQAADDTLPCSITITLSSAIIDFDEAAVASIAKQSGGKEITLSLEDKNSSKLNKSQAQAIENMEVSSVFEVSLSASKQISDFGKGTAAIGIPFAIPADKRSEGYSVWHIAEDGKAEKISTAYRSGMLCFIVPHFSDYVVAYEEPPVSFTDVVPGSYYENAVAWAVKNGVTTGTSTTTFSPDASTTRAQVVTFLWRAAGKPVVDYAMSFRDVPSDYYTEAVRWAVSKGITTGTSADTFSPDAVCTRGQIVTFLARYMGAGEVATQNPFTDVLPGMYYTNPVLWALANGITSGKTPTTFAPDGICTRAEVVTFLWRCVS